MSKWARDTLLIIALHTLNKSLTVIFLAWKTYSTKTENKFFSNITEICIYNLGQGKFWIPILAHLAHLLINFGYPTHEVSVFPMGGNA